MQTNRLTNWATCRNRAAVATLGVLVGLMLGGCQSSPKQRLELDPSRSVAAARVAYERADLLSAEALLQRHLQVHPQDGDSWFLLGNIYLRTAQYAAAQHAYSQASRLNPEQADIWHNLSLVYLRQATQVLLEGQLHHDDTYQPLLGWLLHMQGVSDYQP
ncbi:tetratricopeptide repeat protein [Aliidiomarina maris]|uniref:TPR repeat protein n=1 Tax=Aliidiomarina maris TaxID=531312 RepID=A0A327WRL4_9GAMM|nr:tetratricopeptide repeat protein [Aliidiomarina maris]MBA3987776.1 hypothetical protein [Idiomarina sp.]RAJ93672.1 TPR repeat protein [Aliidiomarina maris]RUO19389.1 hypothetical protein CWE07_12975 [Aliidiomarina maris]